MKKHSLKDIIIIMQEMRSIINNPSTDILVKNKALEILSIFDAPSLNTINQQLRSNKEDQLLGLSQLLGSLIGGKINE